MIVAGKVISKRSLDEKPRVIADHSFIYGITSNIKRNLKTLLFGGCVIKPIKVEDDSSTENVFERDEL